MYANDVEIENKLKLHNSKRTASTSAMDQIDKLPNVSYKIKLFQDSQMKQENYNNKNDNKNHITEPRISVQKDVHAKCIKTIQQNDDQEKYHNEQFDQDEIYGEDFQPDDTKQQKVQKSKTSSKHNKVNERNSLCISKSVNSISHLSRKKTIIRVHYEPLTQREIVEQNLYHTESQLKAYNYDQINRLNNRVRRWIQKISDQINFKISSMILQVKITDNSSAINQKSHTPQHILELLQETKNNNQQVLDMISKEVKKLTNQQGAIKEEEFQILKDKEIQFIIQLIQEEQRLVTKLKMETLQKGKKLHDSEEYLQKRNLKYIDHLKSNILQLKKQNQKNSQRIIKFQGKFEKITNQNCVLEETYKRLIKEAEQKNIIIFHDKSQKINQMKDKIKQIQTYNLNAKKLQQKQINKNQIEIKSLKNQIEKYLKSLAKIQQRIHQQSNYFTIDQQGKKYQSKSPPSINKANIHIYNEKNVSSINKLKEKIVQNVKHKNFAVKSHGAIVTKKLINFPLISENKKQFFTIQSKIKSKKTSLKQIKQLQQSLRNQAYGSVWEEQEKPRFQAEMKVQQISKNQKYPTERLNVDFSILKQQVNPFTFRKIAKKEKNQESLEIQKNLQAQNKNNNRLNNLINFQNKEFNEKQQKQMVKMNKNADIQTKQKQDQQNLKEDQQYYNEFEEYISEHEAMISPEAREMEESKQKKPNNQEKVRKESEEEEKDSEENQFLNINSRRNQQQNIVRKSKIY